MTASPKKVAPKDAAVRFCSNGSTVPAAWRHSLSLVTTSCKQNENGDHGDGEAWALQGIVRRPRQYIIGSEAIDPLDNRLLHCWISGWSYAPLGRFRCRRKHVCLGATPTATCCCLLVRATQKHATNTAPQTLAVDLIAPASWRVSYQFPLLLNSSFAHSSQLMAGKIRGIPHLISDLRPLSSLRRSFIASFTVLEFLRAGFSKRIQQWTLLSDLDQFRQVCICTCLTVMTH